MKTTHAHPSVRMIFDGTEYVVMVKIETDDADDAHDIWGEVFSGRSLAQATVAYWQECRGSSYL